MVECAIFTVFTVNLVIPLDSRYFNDKILSVEEDSVKFSFEGNKYTMERIGSDPEHSGQYKCVLKNKIKEVEEVGQVTVIGKTLAAYGKEIKFTHMAVV